MNRTTRTHRAARIAELEGEADRCIPAVTTRLERREDHPPYYIRVDPGEVERSRRVTAELMTEAAADDVGGLRYRPEVQFFQSATKLRALYEYRFGAGEVVRYPYAVRGAVSIGERQVFLMNVDTWGVRDVAMTVAHEVMHLWQHTLGRRCCDALPAAALERHAEDYAEWAMICLWPGVEAKLRSRGFPQKSGSLAPRTPPNGSQRTPARAPRNHGPTTQEILKKLDAVEAALDRYAASISGGSAGLPGRTPPSTPLHAIA